MRKTITVALAAATLASGAAIPAFAKPIVPDVAAVPATSGLEQVQYRRYRSYNRCYPGERAYDCRERMRWERRHGGYYSTATAATTAATTMTPPPPSWASRWAPPSSARSRTITTTIRAGLTAPTSTAAGSATARSTPTRTPM